MHALQRTLQATVRVMYSFRFTILALWAISFLMIVFAPTQSKADIIYETIDESLATTTVNQGNGNAVRRQKVLSNISSATGIKYVRFMIVDNKTTTGHEWQFTISSCAFSDCSGPAATLIASSDSFEPGAGTTTVTLPMTTGANTPIVSGTTYRMDIIRSAGSAYVATGIGTRNPPDSGCGTTCQAPLGAGQMWIVLYDDAPPERDTAIESMVPPNGGTVGTSTPYSVGAAGYVKTTDFVEGMYLRIEQKPSNAGSAWADWFTPSSLSRRVYEFPISTSGDFSVSTTSLALPNLIGEYRLYAQIISPSYAQSIVNWFGINSSFSALVSTTSSYVVGQRSAFDDFVDDFETGITDFYASTTVSWDSCASFTGFSLRDCLNTMFIPPQGAVSDWYDSFRSQFLTYAPWGYVTEFISLLVEVEPQPLPAFEYSFGSSSPPALQGKIVYMQWFDHFDETNSIRDDRENKTIWEVIEPLVALVVAFGVLSVILFDIAGIRFASASIDEDDIDKGGALSKSDSYSRKVASLKDSKPGGSL